MMMPLIALLLMQAAPAPAPPAAPVGARIDHVALSVADLDRSVAFYQRLFGLREIPAPVVNRRWFDLGGGVALHLIPDRKAVLANERSRHLALAVTGFPAFVDRLIRDRVPFTDFAGKAETVQTLRTDGVKQVFLRDPDGNWLEVNDADHRGQ